MPYSRVTKSKYGRASIRYCENGHGHNGNKNRNECVNYVNLIPGVDVADQMQVFWDKARQNHHVQIIRVIQSYSKEELNPDDPTDIEKAGAIGKMFIEKFYKGRQGVVYVQRDGKGGCLHAHVLISDTDMKTYKGCSKNQYYYKTVEQWTDQIAEQFIDLKKAERTPDKVTQTERVKREQGVYVWKDDLKMRILDAATEAEDESDFLQKLTEHGVEATARESKKRGRYWTYELVDFSGVPDGEKPPQHSKMRSYNLGDDFSPEAIKAIIAKKHREIQFEKPVDMTESIEQEQIDIFETDLPIVSLSPTTDDDEEIQRERKRNERRRRTIQQELRKARHAELMRKFGDTTFKNDGQINSFELSL